jgi:ParB-like chromosome segregation protein Spo0J
LSDIDLLAEFWEEMLSEEEVAVRRAWARLSPQERPRVLAHLRAMAEEEGWQLSQRKAAQGALRFLESDPSRAAGG